MTHAKMPGRGTPPLHAVAPLRCSLAESLSDAERAMLIELGVHETPPRLRLVPRAAPPAPNAITDADTGWSERGELIADLAMWAVLLVSVACAIGGLATLPGIAP